MTTMNKKDEKINARIDEKMNCRCGKCSHILFKLTDKPVQGRVPFIEIKCHSCKAINKF